MNFGVALVELRVHNWSSRLRIGAHCSNLEHTVHVWSSRFRFGAHGSTGKHHDLIFWACCDKGFWACNQFRVLDWMGMQPVQGFSFFGHVAGSGF